MNYWNFQKQKFHFYLVHWTQLPLAEASKANRCQRKWNDFSIFMDKNFQKKLWFYSHIQTKMKWNKTVKSVEVCQRTYAAICLIQVLLLPVLLSFFFFSFLFLIRGVLSIFIYFSTRFQTSLSFIHIDKIKYTLNWNECFFFSRNAIK